MNSNSLASLLQSTEGFRDFGMNVQHDSLESGAPNLIRRLSLNRANLTAKRAILTAQRAILTAPGNRVGSGAPIRTGRIVSAKRVGRESNCFFKKNACHKSQNHYDSAPSDLVQESSELSFAVHHSVLRLRYHRHLSAYKPQ